MADPKTIQKYTGLLSKIEIATIKTGKNLGGKFRKIDVGKAHFSVFDGKWFPVLEELDGKMVDVEYTTRPNPDPDKRDFWDFEGITLGVAQESAAGGRGNGNGSRGQYTDQSIEAQVAVKAAVAYAEGMAVKDIFHLSPDGVCALAERFIAIMQKSHGGLPTVDAAGGPSPEAKPVANSSEPAETDLPQAEQMTWTDFYTKAGELGFQGVAAVCKALGIKKIDDWAETKELALEQLGHVAAGNAQRRELPF